MGSLAYVECKLGEKPVDRSDGAAELLKTNRTDVVKTACIAYLKNMEIESRKAPRSADECEADL